MNTKKNVIAVIVIAVIAAALVGWNTWRSSLITRQPQNATTTRPLIGEQTIQVGGESVVPQYRGALVDALGTDEILKQLTPEQQSRYLGELQRLAKHLKENPGDFSSWLQAASLKIFFNDYTGARDIWEYVAQLVPEDPTAYLNLGTVYAWNLSDYPRAERNFKKVITLAPSHAQGYIRLAELYRMFWTEKKGEAVAVLLDGLRQAPRDRDLLLALANTYKDAGDNANALKYYEEYVVQDSNNKDVNDIIAALKAKGL